MRVLLICCLLLMTLLVSGQSNFLDHDKIWSEAFVECIPEGDDVTSSWYRIGRDEIMLDDHIYYPLESSDQRQADQWYRTGYLLREEGKKVYMRQNNSATEGLIYDWGVEEGDQLDIYVFSVDGTLSAEVTAVEYLSTPLGEKRKIILTGEYGTQDVWIEDMGSVSGLPHSGNYLLGLSCGNYEYICMHWNGELMVMNEKYDDCFVSGIQSIEDVKALGISAYPNPVRNSLIIEYPFHQGEMSIVNLQGQTLMRQDLDFGTNNIACGNLLSGFYLLRLDTPKASAYQKICIQP